MASAASARIRREAKFLGRLEVNGQSDVGRRLYWKAGWLLAHEDAITMAGSPVVYRARPVGERIADSEVERNGYIAGSWRCPPSPAIS
jgi:hypothetical protein